MKRERKGGPRRVLLICFTVSVEEFIIYMSAEMLFYLKAASLLIIRIGYFKYVSEINVGNC